MRDGFDTATAILEAPIELAIDGSRFGGSGVSTRSGGESTYTPDSVPGVAAR
jgi:hypothetical protein